MLLNELYGCISFKKPLFARRRNYKCVHLRNSKNRLEIFLFCVHNPFINKVINIYRHHCICFLPNIHHSKFRETVQGKVGDLTNSCY
jgi:hypothetical protein